MKIEDTILELRVVTLTLEGEEVKQFRNFLRNAKSMKITSSYDEHLIDHMIQALKVE